MRAVSIIGNIDEQDNILKQIVKSCHMHIQSVQNNFNSQKLEELLEKENLETSKNFNLVNFDASHDEYAQIKADLKRINEVYDRLEIKEELLKSVKEKNLVYDYKQIEEYTKEIFNSLKGVYSELRVYLDKKEELQQLADNLNYINSLNVDINQLKNLKQFDFMCFKTLKENSNKLFDNYENIPSIMFKVYERQNYDVIASFTPKIFKEKASEIFNSINYEEVSILNENFTGTPTNVIGLIEKEIKGIDKNISQLRKEREIIFHDNINKIIILNRSMDLQNTISSVKSSMLYTKNLFYIYGFIPETKMKDFNSYIEKYSNLIVVIEREPKSVEHKLPIKMKNNFLVKPFEMIVKLYGIPSYHEADPTLFLGLTYMLFFGAMFGDVGQGFVLVLAGIILKALKKFGEASGIAIRIGTSSIIFGFLYGSIFGLDDVIPALVIRPMYNIMTVLMIAIGVGVALLIFSYCIGIRNKLKEKNIEEGIFGEKGIVGLLIYIGILGLVLVKVLNIQAIPIGAIVAILIILIIMLILKQPLSNLFERRKQLFNSEKSEYLLEQSVGLLEVFISMFSNTLSFVRVGAFAISHAALFVAFAAISNIMPNTALSVVVYVVANILVIGLEGLVVIIQCLRLEFYELFSKYYQGDGTAYDPIRIKK